MDFGADLAVIDPVSRVDGDVEMPGDKSISHRLAMIGSIAEGTTRIQNFASSADSHSTLACLERLGVKFAVDVDQRISMAAQVGAHKTSMLQDLERGKSLELDALLGAVVEMGRLVGAATPMCESILALVRQRARVAGCETAER